MTCPFCGCGIEDAAWDSKPELVGNCPLCESVSISYCDPAGVLGLRRPSLEETNDILAALELMGVRRIPCEPERN